MRRFGEIQGVRFGNDRGLANSPLCRDRSGLWGFTLQRKFGPSSIDRCLIGNWRRYPDQLFIKLENLLNDLSIALMVNN